MATTSAWLLRAIVSASSKLSGPVPEIPDVSSSECSSIRLSTVSPEDCESSAINMSASPSRNQSSRALCDWFSKYSTTTLLLPGTVGSPTSTRRLPPIIAAAVSTPKITAAATA